MAGEFKNAIKVLEESLPKHKKSSSFIKSKLKRLRDLQNNMPGAQGLGR